MSVASDTRSVRPSNRTPRFQASGLAITAVVCAGLVVWGGFIRAHSDLVAEEGLGYTLGVSGLAMMVLLLTYSLRKRMPKLLGGISISRWFEIHMMLGLAGPTAVLYHCNFRLGSLNSNIALVSMLLVSASGIAGRFMYTRIHHGLLGDRATLGELHEHIASERVGMSHLAGHTEHAAEVLRIFETYALSPRRNALMAVIRFLTLSWRAGWARRKCIRSVEMGTTAVERRAYRNGVHDYLMAVRRAAEFSSFAWLFSLWHALHLPLCILLFTAAAVHVLAVNLY